MRFILILLLGKFTLILSFNLIREGKLKKIIFTKTVNKNFAIFVENFSSLLIISSFFLKFNKSIHIN